MFLWWLYYPFNMMNPGPTTSFPFVFRSIFMLVGSEVKLYQVGIWPWWSFLKVKKRFWPFQHHWPMGREAMGSLIYEKVWMTNSWTGHWWHFSGMNSWSENLWRDERRPTKRGPTEKPKSQQKSEAFDFFCNLLRKNKFLRIGKWNRVWPMVQFWAWRKYV